MSSKKIESLPVDLSSGLTTREAIIDTLYRCVNAFDMADDALLESSFTPDGIFDLNGDVMEGIPAIKEKCFNFVKTLDTTHFITNERVQIKSDTTASMTCNALAQHYRPGQGRKPGATRLLTGNQYYIDLVKDESDGLWKINNLKLHSIWTEGDWDVFSP